MAYAGTNTILLNLDETAIEQAIPRRHGHMLQIPSMRRKAEGISRHESHGHLTLVAVLAAETELQPLCPQLVLCKDSRLTRRERAELRDLEAPFEWVEGTNGWVTGENFPDILTRVRRPFQRRHPDRPVILLLDAALQHVSDAALAQAARLRVQLLVVPAGLTWLLQPLDTHVFACLKRELHRLQERARVASVSGQMPPGGWIVLLQRAVRQVILSRNWRHAFAENGLLGEPEALRGRIRDVLPALTGAEEGGVASVPTDEDLDELLGRHRRNVRPRLLGPSLRHAERGPLPLPAPAAPSGLPPLPPPAIPPPLGIPLDIPAAAPLQDGHPSPSVVSAGPFVPRAPIGRRLVLAPLRRGASAPFLPIVGVRAGSRGAAAPRR